MPTPPTSANAQTAPAAKSASPSAVRRSTPRQSGAAAPVAFKQTLKQAQEASKPNPTRDAPNTATAPAKAKPTAAATPQRPTPPKPASTEEAEAVAPEQPEEATEDEGNPGNQDEDKHQGSDPHATKVAANNANASPDTVAVTPAAISAIASAPQNAAALNAAAPKPVANAPKPSGRGTARAVTAVNTTDETESAAHDADQSDAAASPVASEPPGVETPEDTQPVGSRRKSATASPAGASLPDTSITAASDPSITAGVASPDTAAIDPATDDDAAAAAVASVAGSASRIDAHLSADLNVTAIATGSAPSAPHSTVQPAATTPTTAVPASASFAEANHPQIITGIHGQLLPHGGTMQIRLDPPDLGSLHIRVDMRDGVLSATFQTSSDDATHLLSHSLGQLKGALEAQGVNVEKLQVQQAPRGSRAGGEEGSSQQQRPGEDSATQDQHRRETLQRLWRRLANGSDPLDLVA